MSATATVTVGKWVRGPQGGRYWGWSVRDAQGNVVASDGGYATKRESVAAATRSADRRGYTVTEITGSANA